MIGMKILRTVRRPTVAATAILCVVSSSGLKMNYKHGTEAATRHLSRNLRKHRSLWILGAAAFGFDFIWMARAV